MKFDMTPAAAGLPPICAEPDWWEGCLKYAASGGWIPELAVPRDTGGGLLPWMVYVPDLLISSSDAQGMADGLEAWHGSLKPQYNPLMVATDREIVSRSYLAGWLRAAGAVHLQHWAPWKRERLAGIQAVKLANCTGESVEMATEKFYELLEFARDAGWTPRGAANDRHTPDSLHRSSSYDVLGAIFQDDDMAAMLAAVKEARPMIVSGLPLSMLPPNMQPAAQLVELHRRGQHRSTGWIRLILPE